MLNCFSWAGFGFLFVHFVRVFERIFFFFCLIVFVVVVDFVAFFLSFSFLFFPSRFPFVDFCLYNLLLSACFVLLFSFLFVCFCFRSCFSFSHPSLCLSLAVLSSRAVFLFPLSLSLLGGAPKGRLCLSSRFLSIFLLFIIYLIF